MSIEREITALERLEDVIKDRKGFLTRGKKARDRAPRIKAVVVPCPGCPSDRPTDLTIRVLDGIDGAVICRCGKRVMAGWDGEGILTAYVPELQKTEGP